MGLLMDSNPRPSLLQPGINMESEYSVLRSKDKMTANLV
jgi:hypothetical protein